MTEEDTFSIGDDDAEGEPRDIQPARTTTHPAWSGAVGDAEPRKRRVGDDGGPSGFGTFATTLVRPCPLQLS